MPRDMTPYTFQTASDIIRDGLGAELLNANGDVIAEIFRCDRDKTLCVSGGIGFTDVPLHVFQAFIARAIERLDPFEDDTPIGSVL